MSVVTFQKTGKEIKTAVQKRRQQLQERLDKRNAMLNDFLKDTRRVRSYMVRTTQNNYSHGGRGYVLFSKDDISSEEQQEVERLCRRIFEIEQELHRLALLSVHLGDDQIFDLSFDDLIGYGFDASLDE
jgi:hypothetical protein